MKLLIIISLSILSFNVFSAELGEDQKGECPYANQSSKREAKEVAPVETDIQQQQAASTISK